MRAGLQEAGDEKVDGEKCCNTNKNNSYTTVRSPTINILIL